jgi:hypothetical protein
VKRRSPAAAIDPAEPPAAGAKPPKADLAP